MTLPPLTHLRAFEAAARHGSFLRAAAELGMTPAAVSQHVKALEAWMGLALFDRHPRGVTLTAAGQDFGAACQRGLEEIARAAARLTGSSRGRRVSLACQPSIVSLWLAHRLPRFRAANPDIQVSIVYPLGARTPEDAGSDLLIGHGLRPDRPADAILSAATRPIAAPAYLDRSGPLTTPEALLRAELLHDATEDAWRGWFGDHRLVMPQGTGPIFADFSLLVSSVLAGLGVGLCPVALVEDQLRSGALSVVSDHASDTAKDYWLISRPRPSPEAELMRRWLMDEAGR